MKTGIYKITCTAYDSTYIGSAVNIEKRFNAHLNALKRKNHRNVHLQRVFNIYGEDTFKFEVINECTQEELVNIEFSLIEKYVADGQKLFNVIKDRNDGRNNKAHLFNRDADFRQRVSEASKLANINRFKDPIKRLEAGERLNNAVTPEMRKELASKGGKALWNNPESRAKAISQRKEYAKTDEYKCRNAKALAKATVNSHTVEARAKASASMNERRKDPKFGEMIRESQRKAGWKTANRMKERWADPVLRELMLEQRRKKKLVNQQPSGNT